MIISYFASGSSAQFCSVMRTFSSIRDVIVFYFILDVKWGALQLQYLVLQFFSEVGSLHHTDSGDCSPGPGNGPGCYTLLLNIDCPLMLSFDLLNSFS